MSNAVFLDRDGVINRYPGDADYVKSWEEFHFLPGVGRALKRLQEAGYLLVVASNQAGVSKGMYSQAALDRITENMRNGLRAQGVEFTSVNYCTHRTEDNCTCRKPKPGMVHAAVSALKKDHGEVSIKESYFVGDTIRDIETGKAAGLTTILVFSGKEQPDNKATWVMQPDYTAADLAGAADLIVTRKATGRHA